MPSATDISKKQRYREAGIDTKFFLSKSVYLGSFEKFLVFLKSKKEFYVGTFEKNKFYPVVYLCVDNISKKKIGVDMVYVTQKYRGKNLAMKFYRYLITEHGYTIVSGGSQSPGGKSIWIALSKQRNVDVRLGCRDYSCRRSSIRFINGKYRIPPGIDDTIVNDVYFIASENIESEFAY